MKGRLRWDCRGGSNCKVERNELHFEELGHCFPGGIVPTNVDLEVERKGRFLVSEVKPAGTPVPGGQRYLLKAKSKIDAFTVFITYLDDGCSFETVSSIQPVVDGYIRDRVLFDYDSYCALLRRWFAYADGRVEGDFELLGQEEWHGHSG